MDRQAALAYARIVAQLLLADGQLTVGETSFLRQLGQRLGLPAKQVRALYLTISDPRVVDEGLTLIPPSEHDALLSDLEAAGMADGSFAPSERVFVNRVRRALGR